MHYTITTVDGTQSISLDKTGNQYDVVFHDNITGQHACKTFHSFDKAEVAFLKIAKHFNRNMYSLKDYAGMLKNT